MSNLTFSEQNYTNVAIVMGISSLIVIFIWGTIHYWDTFMKFFAKCLRKKTSISPSPPPPVTADVKAVDIK